MLTHSRPRAAKLAHIHTHIMFIARLGITLETNPEYVPPHTIINGIALFPRLFKAVFFVF